MKKLFLLAALICMALCLCACSGWELEIKRPGEDESEVISENSELQQSGEDENKSEHGESEAPAEEEAEKNEDPEEKLLKEAETLTEALACCVAFSNIPDPPLCEMEPAAIYQFICGYYAQSEKDEAGIYHFKKSDVETLVKNTFGLESFDASSLVSSFDYDEQTDMFSTGFEFGFGYGWSCTEILEAKIDKENSEITVLYKVTYGFPRYDGPDVLICQNRFNIHGTEDQNFYLQIAEIAEIEAEGEDETWPKVDVVFGGKAEFEDFSFSLLKSSTMYDWTWERGWVQDGNIIYDEDGNEYIVFAGKTEILDESEPFSETDKLFSEAEITRELSFNSFPCRLYVTQEPVEGLGISKTTYNYCILNSGSLYRIELHPTMGRGGFDIQVLPFEKCLETIEFK